MSYFITSFCFDLFGERCSGYTEGMGTVLLLEGGVFAYIN
jgi:hypothetical protein